MRKLCFRWIERQRNEALETTRFLLLFSQSNQVIHPILDRLDVAIEHCCVRLQTEAVDFSRQLQPAFRVALVRADHRASWLAKYLSATAGTGVETRIY